MLRTNLSTRPFYNERAVHVLAAVVALAVLAVTAWQVVRIVRLSRYKTDLNTAIRRDKNQIEYLTREAEQVRRGLNQKELALVAGAAKEANRLIEQRTFSWTALFNQLESNLPEQVMLTGVRPDFTKEGTIQVSLDIQGKSSDANEEFWARLEKTGSFSNILWSAVDVSDEGFHRIQMTADYSPAPASAKPASVTGAAR
jgi:Tfp pilus assembly protein PilN